MNSTAHDTSYRAFGQHGPLLRLRPFNPDQTANTLKGVHARNLSTFMKQRT
jgi:hypothetical protein